MKLITVNLGGKERTLDVGRWYFTKYLGEATGEAQVVNNLTGSFESSVNLVWAGLMTYHKVNKVEVDFKREDVEDWIGVLTDSDIEKLINDYNALKDKPGE